MEKNVTLTAEEAFKVTIENQLTFDQCMLEIVDRSKQGNSHACLFREIRQDAMTRLMGMGYLFGTFKDPMGQTFHKITWNQ